MNEFAEFIETSSIVRPRKRRLRLRVRFTLRGLLIAVTLFGVLLGGYLAIYRTAIAEYLRQKQALANIPYEPYSSSWGVNRFLGEVQLPLLIFDRKTFLRLHSIQFHEFADDAPAAVAIHELPDIERLSCVAEFLTPDVIDAIAGLHKLKRVTVYLPERIPIFRTKNELDAFMAEREANQLRQIEALRARLPGVIVEGEP